MPSEAPPPAAGGVDEFLSSIAKDVDRGDRGDRGDGGHRSSSRRDAYPHSDRSSRRRDPYDDDEDRSSRRRRSRDRDREGSPRMSGSSSSRRRHGEDVDDGDDYYRSSFSSRQRRRDAEDDDDYRGGGGGYRDRDRDRRHGPPPPPSSSSSAPYRSSRPSRRGGDPYDDDPYEARRSSRRGGYDDYRGEQPPRHRGGWRDAPREASPGAYREPIPPGTRPISQRVPTNSKWDKVPSGFEGVTASKAKETGLFGQPGQSRLVGPPGAVIGRDESGQAIVPEALPPLRFGGGAGGSAADDQQVGSGANPGNRNARRLYIGNVGQGSSEGNFRAFWRDRMTEMKLTLADGDPTISATVNPDKGFAFIEFRCPEETTNAMSFDGIIFQGQALKIRRPKDYTGPDVAPPAIHVPGVISTNVPDSPNKIYIGSIPTYLGENEIIELLKAFGEVRAFNLVREANNGPSKGFAFCEYVDPSITDAACQGLSDIELGDRKLIAQRASTGQKGGGGASSTGANTSALGSRGAAAALPSAAISAQSAEPTRCMTMLNMVTPQELVDDEEYAEIVEDIREECLKYGSVTDVRIPRPVAQSKGASAQAWSANGGVVTASATAEEAASKEREGVGRVYVRFDHVAQCEAALQAIAGRQFGGRLVICAFLNEKDWPADEDGGESKDATQGMMAGGAGGA